MSRFDMQELQQRISANPGVQQAVNWYLALGDRDRLIVRGLGVLLTVALVFVLVCAPLLRNHQQLAADLERKTATWNLIAENAWRFGSTTTTASADTAVLPLITQSARKAGIKLDRYEQDGKGVRIWIDRIEFDAFISWVEQLQANDHVVVSQITVDSDPARGWVDVRATLSPG
jgi:general secretion pathway protein M